MTLFLPTIAVTFYQMVDKVMLGMMSTNSQSGLYEYAEKIICIPISVIQAIGVSLLPRMSYLYASSDEQNDSAGTIIRKSLLGSMSFSLAAAFGLIAVSDRLVVYLFGSEFLDSGQIIDIPIPFAEESLGNQNLLRILPSFLTVIENGGMLLIDEFSSGFHNELENLMVRYFMEKANGAQMLFVSHSTNLLSNLILRPDQEYSVEFHHEEGSSVKHFSSEQPRCAQNIEKMYVSGVFGGLPAYKEVDDEAQ